MKICNLCLFLHVCLIAEYVSSHVKDVKAHRRLLAAILGYRKEDTDFISDVLKVHNKYRRIHGCNDLSQCARLRQQAGLYAQELADQGVQEPQGDAKLQFGIGQNIYISCGHDVSGEEAVNHWYNEACNYFGNKKSFNEYNHFAQVIWKASYLIGIGRRTSTKSGQMCTYVVARYRPGMEQGPAEFTNIPKGNFDASICSGNAAPGRSTQDAEANIQPGAQPTQTGGEPMPSTSNSGAQSVSPLESSQPAGLPIGGQPAGSSTHSSSMGTSEGGPSNMAGRTGTGGTAGSNSIPNVTPTRVPPTSLPGTGDRERATNPERSHISPLIEQNKIGSEGSFQETGGQPGSPTSKPHCPPCPGDQDQTMSFETSGGAGMLPESPNKPSSKEEGEKPSTSSNPEQPAGSTNPVNPDQANNGEPGKPAQHVNPAGQGRPAEQVNSAEQGKPAEQGNPSAPANPASPDQPTRPVNPTEPINPTNPDKPSIPQASGGAPSAGEKQCPPCVCPNKEGSETLGVGVPQGSQENQPQTAEGSENFPSGRKPGHQGVPSGKEVPRGKPSGTEVSQGGSSEGNVAAPNEVKPSSERGPGDNLASPESGSVSGEVDASKNLPGNQETQGGANAGKTPSQSVSEGPSGASGTSEMAPVENQPTGPSQPAGTGRPNSPSEGAGVSSGGTEGGQVGTENEPPSSRKPEGNLGAQGEGSVTRPESTGEAEGKGVGSVPGGQTGATQGTSGQQGGESSGVPEGGAFIESLDEFQRTSLDAHNKYRQYHKSTPLTHNSEMSAQATEYAQKLAQSGIDNAEHSLKSSRENEGENVYAACGTNPSGADVTKEWYKELCNYDYNKHDGIDAKKPTGHFTQIIWKSSAEFGIGRAYGSNDDCVYIVARYKPAGNVIGSESTNTERGTMDSEYCGREFVLFNKPENSNNGEQLVGQGQPDTTSEVGQEQPNQNTNEVNKQEASIATENNQQNTNAEVNMPETTDGEESNQQNTNAAASGPNISPETTRNSSEGSRQETSAESTSEQSPTNHVPSPEGDSIKRLKTPYLPSYLQKEALENMNKRYRGLRIE